ncbi:uncharacterized protein LOC116212212 [Punica granatum]|uniref:Uncharacterized protein LOC116212212 n=1 Tax=Punica granatum TaxID=22663 RepID=A0A6P8E7Z4_PUNGR|nr:uncharacterized protein LOC116212212 [Punica granatum]
MRKSDYIKGGGRTTELRKIYLLVSLSLSLRSFFRQNRSPLSSSSSSSSFAEHLCFLAWSQSEEADECLDSLPSSPSLSLSDAQRLLIRRKGESHFSFSDLFPVPLPAGPKDTPMDVVLEKTYDAKIGKGMPDL